MFRSLLIANRGEIACRIARTARRLGIETIAVFSEADARRAARQGGGPRLSRSARPPARESYLNIARIIETARAAGAEAIHPGYGFLSENPAFAEACAEAGIVFVGPPASAMRAMGSKSAAKALMEQTDVPLLPGYHGERQDADFLADQAARIGFPVVIKAVSGGGGRGMRVVTAAADFAAALGSARQEAASAFGDDRVLIERYLQRPRHIEVQVFADTHGNAVHLFERDCSAQRRHQKVLEEAPAPGLSDAQRDRMGAAAVAAARAVGYVGAGTVEFVADDGRVLLPGDEHTASGRASGHRNDHRLRPGGMAIARGGGRSACRSTQSAITLNGHAIEARIYAEDPARDFAPSIGRLALFRTPPADGRNPHRYRLRHRRHGVDPLRRHVGETDLPRADPRGRAARHGARRWPIARWPAWRATSTCWAGSLLIRISPPAGSTPASLRGKAPRCWRRRARRRPMCWRSPR